ncbi:uncharacterized protein LOC129596120 [Paramacrobiotus metropolitanus]|uniref:uncharacterized protein LOC129596120 n=1 Tax=Paramacrobiotus metropolitanus TaxID=2943436 RepID=UPI00244581A9|nr:uncharacterized protein LOC129596120 [Paramacrobiotus metropolitanus]
MEMKESLQASASRSFKAGDRVMCCEPVVWALESSYYKTRCAYCLRESRELRTCSGCKFHRYCSVVCQSADWKLEHKLECALLKTEIGGNMETACRPPDPARVLSIKLANKIKLNTMTEIPGAGRKSVKVLLLMLPVSPEQSELERLMTSELSAGKPPNSMPIGVPVKEFLTYYGILLHNAMRIFDALYWPRVPIGLALYPQVTLHRIDIGVLGRQCGGGLPRATAAHTCCRRHSTIHRTTRSAI